MLKEVKGYEGLYWVHAAGYVVTQNWRNSGKEAILRPAVDKKGYKRVGLMREGKLNTHKIHRLVAMAFVPNPENKPQVNHKNGDKQDNHFENLEWVTGSENMKHAISLGLVKMPAFNAGLPGEKNGNALLCTESVVQIRAKFKEGKSRRDLAQEYGVKPSCIKDVVLRKSWKHL